MVQRSTLRSAARDASAKGDDRRVGRNGSAGRFGHADTPAPVARDTNVGTGRKSDVVRARIDPAVKHEAAAVLATIGLSVSDAFRLLLMRVASEQALPFDPLIPNEETIDAMRAVRRGEVTTVRSVAELMSSLNADD